jgi:hypothetical protein
MMSGEFEGGHPQSYILSRYIRRSIHDLFLDVLRRQPKELGYIFSTKEDIKEFCRRMIKYWETEEEYEICSEIQDLCKKYTQKWGRRKKNESETEKESAELAQIFKYSK